MADIARALAEISDIIRDKERELEILRSTRGILQGMRVAPATGTLPPEAERTHTVTEPPKLKFHALSAVHMEVVRLVERMSPVLASDVRRDFTESLWPAHVETTKERTEQLSKWLNEVKNKELIAPDPNNPRDRAGFRWVITEKGSQHTVGQ